MHSAGLPIPIQYELYGKSGSKESYSCVTCIAAKAALVRQPHCFWSYQNTITRVFLHFAVCTYTTLCQRLNLNKSY